MPQIVDGLKDPYGLGGGSILSGSISTACDSYWFYSVTSGTIATIKFSNLSGSQITATFGAGQSIYGNITSVTQSAGLSILYSGSYFPGY
jgi:hypothetical protein